jgi:flagellar protein FliS
MRLLVQARLTACPSGAHPAAHATVFSYSPDLMLIDDVLEHIALARQWMDHEDSCEKHHLLVAAVRIVGELRSSLDVHGGGPYAVNLDDLCDYISRQLVAANVHNQVATLDEVAHLLREVRTAWMKVPYV